VWNGGGRGILIHAGAENCRIAPTAIISVLCEGGGVAPNFFDTMIPSEGSTVQPRLLITLPIEVRAWLEQNHGDRGYATISKFVVGIVVDRINQEAKEQDNHDPTPLEERDKLIDEMGAIRTKLGANKLDAIVSLIPREYPATNSQDDVGKLTDLIWSKVTEAEGFVSGTAISRADVQEYRRLLTYKLRKRELDKMLPPIQ
jgi:hypothetical protein